MTPRADLNPPQLRRLKELFDEALTTTSGERSAFVIESCGDDSILRDELSSLLYAHDASDGYFEKLASDLIGPALSAIDLIDQNDATETNRNVSHYELMERIGGGGMGVVYKARDTRLGRTVALKFLPRRHESDPAARARLLAEARAASALDHPNIGIVYEIAEADDGRQFIAMAWYDGETLKQKIRRGRLPISEVVAIAEQLGQALSAAHDAGIVHRDVKPANVIMTRSGIAKLVDFGIAKLMSADADEMHSTAGTVAYMSPEQTRHGPLDARTDIWSLGVLLYEALAGRRPFRGETDELVVSEIRNDSPAPLATLRPDVPARLAVIVESCLRKNPAGRYQTVKELSEALVSLESDVVALRGSTRTGDISRVARPAFRKHPVAYAALLTVLLGAGAAAAWGYAKNSRETRSVFPSAAHLLSVAVLPFLDLGNADSTRYITDGMSDELRMELLRTGLVTVPSYSSSARYAAGAKPLLQTAAEMGANFVVTGDLESTAGERRLRIRLAEGKTGNELWSSDYDIGGGGRVSIVGNSAKEILSQLGIALNHAEKSRLGRAPTTNARAYDMYLQGRYAELSATPRRSVATASPENMRRAQALYAQARTLDPRFGPARARLAITHMFSATTYDTTQARRDQARVEAEIALRIDPRLFDSHEALATYWRRQGDNEKAIEELETALRSSPGNVSLILALASSYVLSGRWDDGVAQYQTAMRLDPRNPQAAWQAATVYGRMRRNDEGMKAFDRLLEITPDDHEVRVIKGQSYLRWKGTTDTLSEMLRRIPPEWDGRGMATYGRYTVLMVERRFREGLAMLDHARSDLSRDGLVYHPRSLMRAEMYRALGDNRSAAIHYEKAIAVMKDSSAASPNNASIHAALGLAYAGLGRKREAIDEAQKAMTMVRLGRNSINSTAFMGLAIEVFGRVGELDRAFEMVELMLGMPSGREVTVPFLKVWPGFDPLRNDPRFDQLLERFTVK